MSGSMLLFVATCLITGLLSCSKNKGDEAPPQVLSWRLDGGPEVFSDTTSQLSLFGIHSIFGKKGITSMFISTNSTNPGLYTKINASAGFGLSINGTQYTSLSGQVNIATNSNRRLSGTYNSVLINGTVDTVQMIGMFNDIRY